MSLDELSTANLRIRANLAADRLMAVQRSNGYFLYKFHPLNGRVEPGAGNLVRQAGCAYALGRAADTAIEPKRRSDLTVSASRVIDALLSRIVIEAGTVFIAELPKPGVPAWGKLGTLALSLGAIQSPSLACRYLAERQCLVEAILSWQRPDGSFRCRTESLCAADDATSQDYFPGEALMALSLEMQEGCQVAQRAMAAAFPWYRARFRTQPTMAFVPWQLEAWKIYAEWSMGVEAAFIPNAAASSTFVFEMADWLLRFQIVSATLNPKLVGGYSQAGRKPGVSTAAYTEAIIRAFSLAIQLADNRRASRYRKASLMGLDFLRRLQIMPQPINAFPDPIRTVGGTTASLHNQTIRCDYDQHALTAYLTAIETSGLLEN